MPEVQTVVELLCDSISLLITTVILIDLLQHLKSAFFQNRQEILLVTTNFLALIFLLSFHLGHIFTYSYSYCITQFYLFQILQLSAISWVFMITLKAYLSLGIQAQTALKFLNQILTYKLELFLIYVIPSLLCILLFVNVKKDKICGPKQGMNDPSLLFWDSYYTVLFILIMTLLFTSYKVYRQMKDPKSKLVILAPTFLFVVFIPWMTVSSLILFNDYASSLQSTYICQLFEKKNIFLGLTILKNLFQLQTSICYGASSTFQRIYYQNITKVYRTHLSINNSLQDSQIEITSSSIDTAT